MDKAYQHEQTESDLYQTWEDSGLMRADSKSEKPPFTIPLPPPNVTGNLHLGHAAMLAIQDIMIRYKKMQGFEVLWIPGTDHAAIATENVVIKHHGKTSREQWPTRGNFMTDAAAFASEKHDNIVNQTKRMGSWLDWSREAYTFDEDRNLAVNQIFLDLYNDGLIQRGYRLINWSTGAQSVLSDDELEWSDEKESFYYIRCGNFVMGTVRPETKCADSPLVVHPDEDYVEIKIDIAGKSPQPGLSTRGSQNLIVIKRLWDDQERFFKTLNQLDPKASFEVVKTTKGKDLVGQEFTAQTYAGERQFTVIADEVIDPEKGSGAMTISAAHSADDYDLAKRLEKSPLTKGDKEEFFTSEKLFIQKIDFGGSMTRVAGNCAGLNVAQARKKSAQLMKEKGLIVGEDKAYSHRVPRCYRSDSVVEPMISPQWFVMVNQPFTCKHTGKTTTLCQLTAQAVKSGETEIIPPRFEKNYYQWTDNLQDWCISRQIWWGHRIPVWYDENNEIAAVGRLSPEQESQNFRQDEDTLDTWFSSALWPFSTLGWPDEKSADLEKFYPSSVLETGWDILTFWVLRMVMFGQYATGKSPFKTVYLHGMVTDEFGKKMSKSRGNGIDPLIMIEKFGADPVRLALVIGSAPGQNIPIGENKIKGYRNFVNKLWNATRFVKMQTENLVPGTEVNVVSLPDRWITSRLAGVSEKVAAHLDKYEISAAGETIYHFVWDEFCDWYLEAAKVEPNPGLARSLLLEILKLVHPLCPFVTETCWQELTADAGFLIEQSFPVGLKFEKAAEKQFAQVQSLVNAIRKLRAEQKLNPKDRLNAKIKVSTDLGSIIESSAELIKVLATLECLEIGDSVAKGERDASLVLDGLEIYLSIPFDPEAEKLRLEKDLEALDKKIAGLKGRLRNPSYTEKAPAHLVEQTQSELEAAQEQRQKVESQLTRF